MRYTQYVLNLHVLLMAVVIGVMGAAGAEDRAGHARISYDGGGVLVKGPQDPDWARASLNTLMFPGDTIWVDQGGATEIELPEAVFLRLADDSKAEMVKLPPEAHIRGWVGAFYLQRLSRSQGSAFFTTPACTVQIAPDTSVRVDIEPNGNTTVSVRWGAVTVNTDLGGDVTVGDGFRAWVDTGRLPSDPVAFDRNDVDAFDRWNNDRAQVLAEGVKTLPKDVAIATSVEGVSDLSSYGEWVYVDNRSYWRPTVVADYVPYRYGHWNYCPNVGHVWVGDYPFCYVTSHYGRWRYASSYGWLWSYDPVWSPAWAVTVHVGDSFMWAPMDYYSRPVLVSSSSYFSVGGVQFCTSSTSWMSTTYVSTGWVPVCPATPTYFETVCTLPPAQVNIWNIYVDLDDDDHHGHHGHHARPDRPWTDRPRSPFDPDVVKIRDYNPPRSIRGTGGVFDKDAGQPPVDRAKMLEARLNRNSFEPSDRGPAKKERSAVPNDTRRSGLRDVRMDRATALQPDTTSRTRDAVRDTRKEDRNARPDAGNADTSDRRRADRIAPDRTENTRGRSTDITGRTPRSMPDNTSGKDIRRNESPTQRTGVPSRNATGSRNRNSSKDTPTLNNRTEAPQRINRMAPDARGERSRQEGTSETVRPESSSDRNVRGRESVTPKDDNSSRGNSHSNGRSTRGKVSVYDNGASNDSQVAVRDIDPGTPAPSPRPSTGRGGSTPTRPTPRPSTPTPSSPRPSTREYTPSADTSDRGLRNSRPSAMPSNRTEVAEPRFSAPSKSSRISGITSDSNTGARTYTPNRCSGVKCRKFSRIFLPAVEIAAAAIMLDLFHRRVAAVPATALQAAAPDGNARRLLL